MGDLTKESYSNILNANSGSTICITIFNASVMDAAPLRVARGMETIPADVEVNPGTEMNRAYPDWNQLVD